jgi:hypothetical protein
MNKHKLAWYMQSQNITHKKVIDDSVKEVIISGKKYKNKTSRQIAWDVLQRQWDKTWYNPKNLYETYNTPQGGLMVDVVLGVTVPAIAVGRKAKKIIELGRYFHDTIKEDV